MTDSPYRIEIVHDPHSSGQPWDAQIWHDNRLLSTRWGTTKEDALEDARAWIRAETGREPGKDVYYVDADGNDAPAPLAAA